MKSASLISISRSLTGWALFCAYSLFSAVSSAQSIVVSSTTSTDQTGLFRHIIPSFSASSGIKVRVVALGTGQALDIGKRGDADVVFVHDQEAEERFVAEAYGVERLAVMYNDFVLVGPADDPLGTVGQDIVEAMRKIADANAAFVSRGDRSGTHAAELRFWDASERRDAKGSGYRECGCGMGTALNMASSIGAYVLTDRGSWLSFRNRGDLKVLVEGDHRLFNQYGVMLVNPQRHPHVKVAEGQAFIDWLVSSQGQARIASYRIDGEQLFFPNAGM